MDERQKLLAVLNEIRDDVDFGQESALVDDGLIDSLDLTQIIAALAEEFQAAIPAGEIEPENFNSVDAILALIHAYQKK